jgi:hypothetical protein
MQRLQSSRIKNSKINWEEDFYRYHSGQVWVTKRAAGGIFDPLVNALSIVEKILGTTVKLVKGEAKVPSSWEAAISGSYEFEPVGRSHFPIMVKAAWRSGGSSRWDIIITTESGTEVKLGSGGGALAINGVPHDTPSTNEYVAAYEHCANRLMNKTPDVNYGPLQALIDG